MTGRRYVTTVLAGTALLGAGLALTTSNLLCSAGVPLRSLPCAPSPRSEPALSVAKGPFEVERTGSGQTEIGGDGDIAATAVFSSPIYRADNYYLGRRNLENVRKALDILKWDVAHQPNDYEAWWRISEYDCYLARHLPDSRGKPIFEEGVEAGKKAESLDAKRPEGHFWTGANEGLLAEASNVFTGLRMVASIRSEMQTVMRLAPDYQQYGAARILGRLYFRLPFFAGGNKQFSIHLLEDCLKRYPDNSLTLLYLADSYRAVGRREDARRLLERMLKLCPDPIYGPEQADNQAVAREDLRKYFHGE